MGRVWLVDGGWEVHRVVPLMCEAQSGVNAGGSLMCKRGCGEDGPMNHNGAACTAIAAKYCWV